jgi:hypothetical protein
VIFSSLKPGAMKKLLFSLLFTFALSVSLFSQTAIVYEIKVKYNKTSADITVVVKAGDPTFTYFLMTNDPMKGEVIMQSEPTRDKSHVFRDVKPGKYFVKIEDNLGLPAGRTVTVSDPVNSSN